MTANSGESDYSDEVTDEQLARIRKAAGAVNARAFSKGTLPPGTKGGLFFEVVSGTGLPIKDTP